MKVQPYLRVASLSAVLFAGGVALVAQTPAGAGQAQRQPVVIGPSAPIPPEVAMLRPDAAEIAQMNDALKTFIASDKSSAGARAQEIRIAADDAAAAGEHGGDLSRRRRSAWGRGTKGSSKSRSAGNIDLLLHGDSITDWWVSNDDNKQMFEKYFGGIRTANFAIAGDTTQGVLWGLKNGEGPGLSAEGRHGDDRHEQHRAEHRRPRSRRALARSWVKCAGIFPTRRFCCLPSFRAALPGDPVRAKIAEINSIISRLNDDQPRVLHGHRREVPRRDRHVPARGVPADNLHPLAKGYDIWGAAVQAKLAELMK